MQEVYSHTTHTIQSLTQTLLQTSLCHDCRNRELIDKSVNFENIKRKKIMPRLVGKQSNSSSYTLLFLILAIATAGSLEYFGFVNMIPGFGQDRKLSDPSQLQLRQPSL